MADSQDIGAIAQEKLQAKDEKKAEELRLIQEAEEQRLRELAEAERQRKLKVARKKRKLIPPGMMLLAGAVASITMFVRGFESQLMLRNLLLVLLIFYVVGCMIKWMFDRFARENNPETEAESETGEGEVIEKTTE